MRLTRFFVEQLVRRPASFETFLEGKDRSLKMRCALTDPEPRSERNSLLHKYAQSQFVILSCKESSEFHWTVDSTTDAGGGWSWWGERGRDQVAQPKLQRLQNCPKGQMPGHYMKNHTRPHDEMGQSSSGMSERESPYKSALSIGNLYCRVVSQLYSCTVSLTDNSLTLVDRKTAGV